MISIELNDNEVIALRDLFDRALRHSGLQVAESVVYMLVKINNAYNGSREGEGAKVD